VQEIFLLVGDMIIDLLQSLLCLLPVFREPLFPGKTPLDLLDPARRMFIELGVLYHRTAAIDCKRVQTDIDTDSSPFTLLCRYSLLYLNDHIPSITGTGDQDALHLHGVGSVHGERDCSDLREGNPTVFPVDLEPGPVVVERPVSGCTLESEFCRSSVLSSLSARVQRCCSRGFTSPSGALWSTRSSKTDSHLSA